MNSISKTDTLGDLRRFKSVDEFIAFLETIIKEEHPAEHTYEENPNIPGRCKSCGWLQEDTRCDDCGESMKAHIEWLLKYCKEDPTFDMKAIESIADMIEGKNNNSSFGMIILIVGIGRYRR
jgi:hypothetical protein